MSVWNVLSGGAQAAPWMKLLQGRGGTPPYSTPGIGDGLRDGMAAPAATPGGIGAAMRDEAPITSMSPVLEDSLPTDASALAGAPAPRMGGGGVFDRIGNFLGSDDGKAALFRAGAEMLSSGDIGRGLQAGAGWMDQQRINRAQEARWAAEHGLKQQGVAIDQQRADQSGLYQAAQIDDMALGREIEVAKLEEAVRKAQAGEQLDTMEMMLLDKYRTGQLNLGWADNAQRERDSQRDYSASTYSTASQNARHGTVSADTQYSTDATNWRHVNPTQQPLLTTWATKDPETGITSSGKYPRPSEASINHARANPTLRSQFEQQYGPGSWTQYIGN